MPVHDIYTDFKVGAFVWDRLFQRVVRIEWINVTIHKHISHISYHVRGSEGSYTQYKEQLEPLTEELKERIRNARK